MESLLDKIKKFWLENELKIVLFLGLVLVAGVSFESGYLKGKYVQGSPIILEKLSGSPKNGSEEAVTTGVVSNTVAESAPAAGANLAKANCAYVGSKNSNKYHLPSCQWAKRIKPENIVCFSSAEAATAKNYLPDKGCIK